MCELVYLSSTLTPFLISLWSTLVHRLSTFPSKPRYFFKKSKRTPTVSPFYTRTPRERLYLPQTNKNSLLFVRTHDNGLVLMAIENEPRRFAHLRVRSLLLPQRARIRRHFLLQPRVSPKHGYLHRQAPPRDPQARSEGQETVSANRSFDFESLDRD